MSTLIQLLAVSLVFSFATCCIVSALLQMLAWTRHARPDVLVSLRALWRPEGYFDEIGLRQILLSRRLLLIGAVAYLSYGILMIVVSAV